MSSDIMIYVVAAFGLLLGSFLNVCIYRLPREESVVAPASHCPNCKSPIMWYDNVPVLSYVILRGKCRFCKKNISPRYVIVEILTSILLALTFMAFGFDFKFPIYSVLFCGLIVATFVDFKHQIIPDEVTYIGMALGLLLSAIYPLLHDQTIWYRGLLDSGMGLLAGGGSIYLTGVIGGIIFRKEAMGGGDVKLMAMIGAFLGWEYAILIFFIAPFFGSIVGIIMKVKYKAEIIPYGPYLSLAAIVVVFWGRSILRFIIQRYS